MKHLTLLVSALMILGTGAAFALTSSGAAKTHNAHNAQGPRGPRGHHGHRGRRGATGPRGPQGQRGATGPAGQPGGPGSAITLNFNARLLPGGTKSVTIGNFTVSENSTVVGGNCGDITIRAGNLDSGLSIGSGASGQSSFDTAPDGTATGDFVNFPNNSSKTLVVTNTPGGLGASDSFTAVTKDGSSTVAGIVGCFNSATLALTSGYVAGV